MYVYTTKKVWSHEIMNGFSKLFIPLKVATFDTEGIHRSFARRRIQDL